MGGRYAEVSKYSDREGSRPDDSGPSWRVRLSRAGWLSRWSSRPVPLGISGCGTPTCLDPLKRASSKDVRRVGTTHHPSGRY